MKKEFYHDIDLKANQLFNSRLQNVTTDKRSELAGILTLSDKGYVVFDTDEGSPYFWNGLTWVSGGGGSLGRGEWGSITGTITAQTDLITYLSNNYYPLSTNPSGYITSSALSAYVPITRQLSINGTSYDLSQDRSWTISATGGGITKSTASGTDTYTTTITGVSSYTDGDTYLIRFTNGNTTGATLNINGLGAKTLYKNNDGVLIGGDIVDGGEMLCVYNSTLNGFQLIGTAPNTLLSYVTNADSVTLTKGMAVYAFSGTGDRMTVKRAYNTGDSTSAQTIGLVMSTSIGVNQKGLIMMQGLLDGLSILPTSTWADGDPVYLGSTPGSITKTKPYAPNHLVYLGFVTTASPGAAGRMYVRVQNGYEMDELHNVQAQSPSLKDTLWYDNTVTPAQWKTASISTILGYTPLSANQTITLSGDISGSGSTAITTAIGSNKVTNSMLSQVATATFKGRTTSGTGNVEDLTATQATALLNTFTSSLKGLVPSSGGGTTNFLRADGTWAAPSGGGGGGTPAGSQGNVQFNNGGSFGASNKLYWDVTNEVLGVGKNTPLAGLSLDVAGGGRFESILFTNGILSAQETKTSNYTLKAGDEIIWGDASSGNIGIVLPSAGASSSIGRRFTIKKVDETNNKVDINPNGSETIDNQASYTLFARHDFIEVVSDGFNWKIVSKKINKVVFSAVNYTATDSDDILLGDASGNNVGFYLPTAVGRVGKIYTIKAYATDPGTTFVRVNAASGETIDGSSAIFLNGTYDYIMVFSDGSNWYIISEKITP